LCATYAYGDGQNDEGAEALLLSTLLGAVTSGRSTARAKPNAAGSTHPMLSQQRSSLD
jgi:hypothetical protein